MGQKPAEHYIDNPETLGPAILERMREAMSKAHHGAKVTNKDIADKLNVRPNTVSQWAKGRTQPALVVLIKFCDLYNQDYNWIIRGKAPQSIAASKQAFDAMWDNMLGSEQAQILKRLQPKIFQRLAEGDD